MKKSDVDFLSFEWDDAAENHRPTTISNMHEYLNFLEQTNALNHPKETVHLYTTPFELPEELTQ